MRSRTARPWLAVSSLLASQLDATNTSEAQPFPTFYELQTMKNFLLFSFVTLTIGGLGLMAGQSIERYPNQHSGTQAYVRVGQ